MRSRCLKYRVENCAEPDAGSFQAVANEGRVKLLLRDSHSSRRKGILNRTLVLDVFHSSTSCRTVSGPRSYSGVLVPDACMGDGCAGAAVAKACWCAMAVLIVALSAPLLSPGQRFRQPQQAEPRSSDVIWPRRCRLTAALGVSKKRYSLAHLPVELYPQFARARPGSQGHPNRYNIASELSKSAPLHSSETEYIHPSIFP